MLFFLAVQLRAFKGECQAVTGGQQDLTKLVRILEFRNAKSDDRKLAWAKLELTCWLQNGS